MIQAAKSVRELLRRVPSLAGPFAAFDPTDVPEDPVDLFVEWLTGAVNAGIKEPHAMTLSTVDPQGRPSARVLILKNVGDDGWQFASGASGRKGKELADTPWAALTFYWPALGRQVRVRGAVAPVSEAESARDFLSRSASARAAALIAKQSERMVNRNELDLALVRTADQVEAEPGLVSPDWTLYAVDADEVEFWQGDEQRRHIRLSYRRADTAWTRGLLWP
jgi:pyridoxamine 5'-phosphate oxidase